MSKAPITMRRIGRSFVVGWLGVAGISMLTLPASVLVATPLQEPPRDRAPSLRVGTAVLKGRVIDGTTGAAVARVRVRLQGAVQRPSVLTDGSGSFAFSALPAGGYSVFAEKSTYLPAMYPERGRTIRAASRPAVLTDGQVETISVPIYHGAAIAGTVVDANGDPVEGASVSALRNPTAGRAGKLRQTNGAQTNDLGEFRIPRLEPGNYVLQVTYRRHQPDEPGTEIQAVPPQPLPTFYPSATSIDQAQVIAIERAQTVSGIDVMLVEGTPTLVTGTVLGIDGQPITTGGSVSVRTTAKNIVGGGYDGMGTGIRPDGTFRMALAPGDYQLEARAHLPAAPVVLDGLQQMTERMGFMKLSVGGPRVDVGTIMVGPGATASGRVVFDGNSAPPTDPKQVRPMLFTSDSTTCRSPQLQVDADWRFRIEGLHGNCAGAQSSMIGRWMLKAIMHDGENLLDKRTAFETGQQLRNLEVVFTDRRPELTFKVSDHDAQTTREFVALVFSADKSQWDDASSFVRTFAPPPIEVTTARGVALTAPGGQPQIGMPPPRRESLSGLRPGDYLVVAVDDIAHDDTRDPAVLARLASRATRVTLGDGANVDVPLRRFKLADLLKEQ